MLQLVFKVLNSDGGFIRTFQIISLYWSFSSLCSVYVMKINLKNTIRKNYFILKCYGYLNSTSEPPLIQLESLCKTHGTNSIQ